MKKRLVILVGMLAVLLVVAIPAFAQQEVTVTGTLYQTQGGYYTVIDETGQDRLLSDEGAGLEAYVGEDVTLYGTPAGDVPEFFAPFFASPLLNITRVEPADGPTGPPPGEDTVTLSFELTVKGTPPEGARFFGSAVGEGGPGTPLTDPDGDGVFTGSVTVPKFPPGLRPVPPGTDPMSLSVRIVQVEQGPFGPGEPSVLRDFGVVPLEEDRTFETRVNFRRDRGDTTTPTSDGGGSDSGGSDNGSSGGGGSETTTAPQSPEEAGVDLNEDGVANAADGEVAASVSDAAIEADKSSGQERTLPSTGGAAPLSLFAELVVPLLAVGGLLVRRATRQ